MKQIFIIVLLVLLATNAFADVSGEYNKKKRCS